MKIMNIIESFILLNNMYSSPPWILNTVAKLFTPNQASTKGTQANGAIGLKRLRKGTRNRSAFLKYPINIPRGIATIAAAIYPILTLKILIQVFLINDPILRRLALGCMSILATLSTEGKTIGFSTLIEKICHINTNKSGSIIGDMYFKPLFKRIPPRYYTYFYNVELAGYRPC